VIEASSYNRVWIIAITAIHDAAVTLGRGLLTVPTSPRVTVNSLESFSSKREHRKILRLQQRGDLLRLMILS